MLNVTRLMKVQHIR